MIANFTQLYASIDVCGRLMRPDQIGEPMRNDGLTGDLHEIRRTGMVSLRRQKLCPARTGGGPWRW